MTEAPPPTAQKRAAPWRGRKRAPDDAKDKFIVVRCTLAQRTAIEEAGRAAGYKVGPYLRTLALGSPGPRAVRRLPVEREHLARVLGEIGKLGSNVNQIAKWSNTEKSAPSSAELAQMRADIAAMRAEVMKALDRGD